MISFQDYLREGNVPKGLAGVLMDIAFCAIAVADAMRMEKKGYAGGENVHGEKQLKLDVFANDVFVDILERNSTVATLASEEMEEAIVMMNEELRMKNNGQPLLDSDEVYAIAFDPLDGSSLVDVNLAVGSIFGIYKGTEFLGKTGRDQTAALIVVYGPRLTFIVTTGNGVDEFIFDPEKKEFVLNNAQLKIAPSAKMFAPGNLRACASEDWYVKLMNYWVKEGYTLRYSGGMVPDVNQILRKGGGVFTYPGYHQKPQGKLRLLYECAPMAFLIEQAGGRAVSMTNDELRMTNDGISGINNEELRMKNEGGMDVHASLVVKPILDIEIRELHQKTPIFLGSADEVKVVERFFEGAE